jgi:predicted transcriptional regulator
MTKISRRDRMKIYGDLLSTLHSKTNPEKIVLTHVQLRIKVPYDRLKTYIKELIDLSLIKDEDSLKLTDKGQQYLREYEKVLDFMNRMGITYQ